MRVLLRETARGLRRDRMLLAVMVGGLAIGVTDWQLTDLLWREQQHKAIADGPSLFVVAVARENSYEGRSRSRQRRRRPRLVPLCTRC